MPVDHRASDPAARALSELADRLDADVTRIRMRIQERVRDEVPDYYASDAATMTAGYDSLNSIIRDVAAAIRPDALQYAVPVRILEEMQSAARQNMQWGPLEDALRAGMTELWECLATITPTLAVDRATQADTLHSASRTLFRWFDIAVREARAAFYREKSRVTEVVTARRANLVQNILAGRPVRAEQLGHPLARWHLASVLWRPGGTVTVAEIPQTLGDYPVLASPGQTGTVLAFVALIQERQADTIVTESFTAADVRRAVGSVHYGPAGFARSHAEAVATYDIAIRKLDGHSRQHTTYREVDIETLLFHDTAAAARMAHTTLGELGLPHPKREVLRHTLHTYLNEGLDAATTASKLHLSERTIRNHVSRAQDLLPRPLHESLIQVGVALRVHLALTLRDQRLDETVLPRA